MASDLVGPGKSDRKPARELSAEQAAAAAMVVEAEGQRLGVDWPTDAVQQECAGTALDEEMTEHLGHEKNQAEPERGSRNVRNGTRSKMMVSDAAGEARTEMARDRESTFEPQIVRKRQRWLTDVGEIVLSPYAKGMTTGEISVHVAEIYGASVSKERSRGSAWTSQDVLGLWIGAGGDGAMFWMSVP
jgi:putative transposase